MPVVSGVSVDNISGGQLRRFYRLALALCGDKPAAEQILIDTCERARAADYVQGVLPRCVSALS
jgi:hypothetical protein